MKNKAELICIVFRRMKTIFFGYSHCGFFFVRKLLELLSQIQLYRKNFTFHDLKIVQLWSAFIGWKDNTKYCSSTVGSLVKWTCEKCSFEIIHLTITRCFHANCTIQEIRSNCNLSKNRSRRIETKKRKTKNNALCWPFGEWKSHKWMYRTTDIFISTSESCFDLPE